jgi:hypothetical protein
MKHVSAFTQIGSTARACLVPGQRGKILAVFSKAIYLLTETDQLFWITTAEDAPMHQRCAQISSHLPGPSGGSTFRVKDHRLMIDPGFVFEVDNALPWSTPRGTGIPGVTLLPARIDSLFSNLDVSQAKGFGIFIPHILDLSDDKSTTPASVPFDPILSFAQPLALDMARACLEHQPARISFITNPLIGLGAGLTPSGDDFLGGMFFTLKVLHDLYPDEFPDYAVTLEPYRSRTHLISFTLLNDLANGHAIAPLHSIINGLLCGDSLENIFPFVLQLTQVGHSTGWDLLTGLLTGLLTVYRSNYFISSFQTTQTMEV